MRKSAPAMMLLALMLALVAGAPASASEEQPEVTVQGEILGLACYMAHDARGPKHAKCAKMCMDGGQPMGLLAEDGTVYLLYAGHGDASGFESAKSLAGKTVVVSGKRISKGGLRGIQVASVKPS